MLEWMATILSLIGAGFIVKKKWQGYVAWFGGNTFWLILGIINKSYGQVLTFAIFNLLSIYGVYEWKIRR